MTQNTYQITLVPVGRFGFGPETPPDEMTIKLDAESETDAWKQAFEACSETQATIEQLPE